MPTKTLESLEKKGPMVRRKEELDAAMDAIDDNATGSDKKRPRETEEEYQRRMRKQDNDGDE